MVFYKLEPKIMNLSNHVFNFLQDLKPLLKKLNKIMADESLCVSQMPFSVQKSHKGVLYLTRKNGAVAYCSELNTYFDSSLFAMNEVSQDCANLIGQFDIPEDELYSFLKNSVFGLSSSIILDPLLFHTRDQSIDEKSSFSHNYICDSINFTSKETNPIHLYSLINSCHIFKCLTLLLDENRPFMKSLSITDNMRNQHDFLNKNNDLQNQYNFLNHKNDIIKILTQFIESTELSYNEIYLTVKE